MLTTISISKIAAVMVVQLRGLTYMTSIKWYVNFCSNNKGQRSISVPNLSCNLKLNIIIIKSKCVFSTPKSLIISSNFKLSSENFSVPFYLSLVDKAFHFPFLWKSVSSQDTCFTVKYLHSMIVFFIQLVD